MKLTHRIIVTTFVTALALPIAAFAAKGDRKKPEAPVLSFENFDKDSNESVSEAEYVSVSEKQAADAARSRFAQLDKNGDGKVSKEEFNAATSATPEKKKKRKNQ
jgi:Ca2+-binding EF-hand superfamily protein